MPGCDYISNPFQVLGKSDTSNTQLTPVDADVEKSSDADTANTVVTVVPASESMPAPPLQPISEAKPTVELHPAIVQDEPIPVVLNAGVNMLSYFNPDLIEKTGAIHGGGGPMVGGQNQPLTFLHHLGTFFLNSALPVLLQVAIPILERKL